MIYVSSECIKQGTIGEKVRQLAEAGFGGIELSGGSVYYQDYLGDLLNLKEKFNLQYLIHGYFPPPERDFVLNLGSLDSRVSQRSVEFCKHAIETARILGSSCYSLHAGFYFDPKIEELGRVLKPRKLYNATKSQAEFRKNFEIIKEFSLQNRVKLYLENNVLNFESYLALNKEKAAMLLSYADVVGLGNALPYNFLLDIGHLKVTANTLGLDFAKECSQLILISDYLHLSDNDGIADRHACIQRDSCLYNFLGGLDLSGKNIVLEAQGSIGEIQNFYQLFSEPTCALKKELVR